MNGWLKGYIEAKPDDAKRLLDENPQIAFALVHMQIKMGLVDQVKARVSQLGFLASKWNSWRVPIGPTVPLNTLFD